MCSGNPSIGPGIHNAHCARTSGPIPGAPSLQPHYPPSIPLQAWPTVREHQVQPQVHHHHNLITHPTLYRPRHPQHPPCTDIKPDSRYAFTPTLFISHPPFLYRPGHPRCPLCTDTSSPTPGTPSPQPHSLLNPCPSTGPGIHDTHCARTSSRLQVRLRLNLITHPPFLTSPGIHNAHCAWTSSLTLTRSQA